MDHPYRFLIRRFVLWLKPSASFLWLFAAAGYLVFLAGHAFYRSYQDQTETNNLTHQLAKAELEKERMQALLVYYHTDSFKEKELRRTLLLKRPEETAYALPESSVSTSVEDAIAQSSGETAKKAPDTSPIWQQWINYLWNGTAKS